MARRSSPGKDAPLATNLEDSLLAAWRTNQRVTAELLAQLPAAVWSATVLGHPRRTVRALAAHLHNTRCSWLRTLGSEHGIAPPARVARRRVTQRQVLGALDQSSRGIEALLQLGLQAGGWVPPSRGYRWRNLALDVGHVLTYFIAHEAHHRGQLVLVARQAGHRLPVAVTSRLWQWKPDAAAPAPSGRRGRGERS